MMDELRNFRTIFNSRDYFSIKVGLNGDSCGGGYGQEDNMATPEVHQHGGPFFNLSNRCVETRCKMDIGGPLRTSGISTWAPIARGAKSAKCM
jgi:hypothetical protein